MGDLKRSGVEAVTIASTTPPIDMDPVYRGPAKDGYQKKRVQMLNQTYLEASNGKDKKIQTANQAFRLYDKVFEGQKSNLKNLDLYDYQTATAMGIITPTHAMIDEFGSFGMSIPKVMPHSEEDVVDYLTLRGNMKSVVASMKVKTSMPRLTNQAWPVIVGAFDAKLNAMILASNIHLASSARNEGIGCKDMMNVAKSFFGEPYNIYFERNQHTAKEVPYRSGSGWAKSTNFEPRVRGVYASPKISTVFGRPEVKVMLNLFLSHPYISPLPDVQKTWFNQRLKNSKEELFISDDQSRFDQRHGGAKLKRAISIVHKTLQKLGLSEKELQFAKESMETELVDIDTMLIRENEVLIGRGGDIVPSGSGWTTIIGTVCNIDDSIHFFSLATGLEGRETVSRLIDNNGIGMRTWGDDACKFFRHDLMKRPLEKVFEEMKRYGLSMDQEAETKFLGKYYVKDGFSVGSFSRIVLSTLFPERRKAPLALVVSIVAKLDLVGGHIDKDRAYVDIVKMLQGATNIPTGEQRFGENKKVKTLGSVYSSYVEKKGDLPPTYSKAKVLVSEIMKDPVSWGLNEGARDISDILHLYLSGGETFMDDDTAAEMLPDNLLGFVGMQSVVYNSNDTFADIYNKSLSVDSKDAKEDSNVKDDLHQFKMRDHNTQAMSQFVTQMKMMDKIKTFEGKVRNYQEALKDLRINGLIRSAAGGVSGIGAYYRL